MPHTKTTHIFFYIILGIALYLFLKIFWPFVTPFIFALVLGVVFYPLYTRIKRTVKNRESLAALITLAAVFFMVMIPLGIFVGLVGKEAFDLANWARDEVKIEQVKDALETNQFIARQTARLSDIFQIDLGSAKVIDQLSEFVQTVGLYLYNQGKKIGGDIFSSIINLFLTFFILFYFFRDGEKIKRRLMDISPLPSNQEIHLSQTFQKVSGAVVLGNAVSSGAQGLITGITFFVFGLGSPVLWGFATALLSLIPAVGGMIIYVPATIILIITKGWVSGIVFFLINLIFSNIVDNVIKPKLIESKVKAHPLLVFFSIMGGVATFGIAGILYGPLIMITFLTLLEMYEKDFKA